MRYSGVRRSCAMLSKAVRSVVVCCSMRSSMALTATASASNSSCDPSSAQALREVALHDGFAGGGVGAHAPRRTPRIRGAQQPHAQRGQRDAPRGGEAESAQHIEAFAGVGADQQPVAVRQVFDARLHRVQHRLAAFLRGDVELDHGGFGSLASRMHHIARPRGEIAGQRPEVADRRAGTPRRCGPSCRRAGAASRPPARFRRGAGRPTGRRPRRAPPR